MNDFAEVTANYFIRIVSQDAYVIAYEGKLSLAVDIVYYVRKALEKMPKINFAV